MQEKKFFVHESSYVDDGVSIGEGTKIWHFSHISKGVEIGAGCNLGHYAVVYGNPAQIKGYMCACGDTIVPEDADKLECQRCGVSVPLPGRRE